MIVARSILTVIMLLTVSWISSACGSQEKPIAEKQSSPPNFTVIPGGEDVQSEGELQGDVLYLDIYSERGIGSAVVLIPNQSRPANIIFRLHLSGLENLQMNYGETIVDASVSSIPPYQVRQSVILKDEGALELDSASPYWMGISIVSGDEEGPPTIPLKDGYFEVGVPEDFLNGEDEEILVSWIDFYR